VNNELTTKLQTARAKFQTVCPYKLHFAEDQVGYQKFKNQKLSPIPSREHNFAASKLVRVSFTFQKAPHDIGIGALVLFLPNASCGGKQ
jgi:hypothetical protein